MIQISIKIVIFLAKAIQTTYLLLQNGSIRGGERVPLSRIPALSGRQTLSRTGRSASTLWTQKPLQSEILQAELQRRLRRITVDCPVHPRQS